MITIFSDENILWYGTVVYCTVLLNILPKFTILCFDHRLYKTIARFTVHSSISLHFILLYSILLYSTLLYSTVLHSTLLYSTLLNSIVVVMYVHHRSRDCSIDIPANALPCLMKQKMEMKNENKKMKVKLSEKYARTDSQQLYKRWVEELIWVMEISQ